MHDKGFTVGLTFIYLFIRSQIWDKRYVNIYHIKKHNPLPVCYPYVIEEFHKRGRP